MTPPGSETAVPRNQRLLPQIYEAYREVLLSQRYAAARLARIRRQSRWIELILAVATPSVVGRWAIWRTQTGGYVWGVLAAIVLILAVAKPFMNWQSEVERRTGIYIDFNTLYFELKSVIIQIAADHGLSADAEKRFLKLWSRYGNVAGNEDPVRSKRLLRRCREDVEQELRTQTFWTPATVVTNPGPPSLTN